MLRFLRLVAVVAATAVVAAGCGGSSPQRGATTRPAGRFPIVVTHPNVTASGIPKSALPGMRGKRAVLLAPSNVAFMTTGSVSCAWWPARLTILGPSAIRVDMRVEGRLSTCTGAVGFPITVKLPRAVDVHAPVSVRLAYRAHVPGGGTIRRSYSSVAPALSRS